MHVFIRKKSYCSVMTHSFANVLYLSICMLVNCSCFYFRLLTFFKIKFLQINHPGPPSECLTVWIQIKTDILLDFIWVQTVCKRLLADDKIICWHAKSYNRLGKYFSVQYIVSFIYVAFNMYMYTINIRTF